MKLFLKAVLCLFPFAALAQSPAPPAAPQASPAAALETMQPPVQPTAHYGHHEAAVLPDPVATPGAIDAQLTTAELCSPTFHTGTVRDVTDEMKIHSCKAYGQNTGCPGAGYEIDHLISIELGGSNDPSNLWPQPVDSAAVVGFHTKDVVEDRAHRAVCAGRITLAQAQAGIRSDWYAFGVANNLLTPVNPKPSSTESPSALPAAPPVAPPAADPNKP